MRDFINAVKLLEGHTTEDAQAFALRKWQERAQERGGTASDLSGSCKFTALFAQAIYGGEIEANEFHTWVRKDGRVIDLNASAEDVQQMLRGEIPDNMKSYAAYWKIAIPEGLYVPDPKFMRSRDFKESLKSCQQRVSDWVREFSQASSDS